jgi:membrane protease YdiL (CAAX protease family)
VDITTRRGFLNLAAAFEGGTLLLGLLLGWVSETLTSATLHVNVADFAWGLAAVLPMCSVLTLASDLREQVVEMLGRSLAACRWYDLAALAMLAGVSEELLFRGVLEGWIGRWDPWAGLVAANVLFGLAHAVTPRYFVFAAAIGVYFSLLMRGWPELGGALATPNLLRPIVAHAVYDFIAFLLVVRDYRQSTLPTAAPQDDV